MERNNVQTGSSKTAKDRDFALEEFKALNTEILARVGRQNTFLGFALVGSGLVARASGEIQSVEDLALFLGLMSFVLWIVLLVLVEQDYQIAIAGTYIQNVLYAKILYSQRPDAWEFHRAKKLIEISYGIKMAMSAKYLLVAVPMLGIDLGFPLQFAKSLETQSEMLGYGIAWTMVLTLKYAIFFSAIRASYVEYGNAARRIESTSNR